MTAPLLGVLGTRGGFARLRRIRWVTPVAVGVLAIAVLLALIGPFIVPADPNAVDILSPYAPSTAAHLLGTDASGRDLLSRLIVGIRSALVGPVLVVLAATLVSIPVVLIAAWRGGWVDTVAARLLDVLMAFPGLLIAVVACAVFGASLTVAALALAISYVPYIARILRADALRERRRPYIEAVWLQGMSATRIAVREILPNLLPVLIGQVVLSISYAVIDLSALSYLGLAVQPPTADLGTMVAAGQDGVLQGHPTETVGASLCIIAIVVALGVVGDRIGLWAEQS